MAPLCKSCYPRFTVIVFSLVQNNRSNVEIQGISRFLKAKSLHWDHYKHYYGDGLICLNVCAVVYRIVLRGQCRAAHPLPGWSLLLTFKVTTKCLNALPPNAKLLGFCLLKDLLRGQKQLPAGLWGRRRDSRGGEVAPSTAGDQFINKILTLTQQIILSAEY